MTAIRLGCTAAGAGHALFPNGERHLRRTDDLPPSILRNCIETPRGRATASLGDSTTAIQGIAGRLDAISHLRVLTWAARLSAGRTQCLNPHVEKRTRIDQELK